MAWASKKRLRREKVCRTCGRPFEPALSIEPIDVDGYVWAGPTGDEAVESGSRRRVSLILLAGVLATMAALWLFSQVFVDQPEPAANPSDATEPAGPETPVAAAGGTEDTSISRAEASDATPFSPLDLDLIYFTDSDLARVQLATGTVDRIPIELTGNFPNLNDLLLLDDGVKTVGIDPADPSVAALLTTTARIIPGTGTDYWLVSNPSVGSGKMSLTLWQDSGYLVSLPDEANPPVGSEILAAPGLGVLVTPPTGGTFVGGPTGFLPISDNRVVAANASVRIEAGCDEQLACQLIAIDSRTGRTTTLPDEFAADAEISLSPDGNWVLIDTRPANLYDLTLGLWHKLEVGGYGGARWSADSQFVAWLDTTGPPALVMVLTSAGVVSFTSLTVDLADHSAAPRAGSGFLLLPPLP